MPKGGALFMTTMLIRVNPQYAEMSDPGVIARGLRGRIRFATSERERVETEFPLKVTLPASTVLEVRVARKEPIEGHTAETFAAHLGEWLHDILDGPMKKKQIIVTVVIGRVEGIWKRIP